MGWKKLFKVSCLPSEEEDRKVDVVHSTPKTAFDSFFCKI